jgi:hypothetical protein
MPSAVWIAIDRTGWKPKVEYPPIRFVRFSSRALREGVKRHLIEGIEVRYSSPPKRLVTASGIATRSNSTSHGKGCAKGCETPDQPWEFARTARVWSVMRPYVEAMVADGA